MILYLLTLLGEMQCSVDYFTENKEGKTQLMGHSSPVTVGSSAMSMPSPTHLPNSALGCLGLDQHLTVPLSEQRAQLFLCNT